MTETMVERVARVLYVRACGDGDWSDETQELRDHYLADARAAIEAMREPTVEMLVSAQEEWMCVRAAEERGDFVWRAMIDAALDRPDAS